MAQVYEHNYQKKAFKVMYNFVMHDSMPPCSKLNKYFKQIDYLRLVLQFARLKYGLSTRTMFAMSNDGRKIKHLIKIVDCLFFPTGKHE